MASPSNKKLAGVQDIIISIGFEIEKLDNKFKPLIRKLKGDVTSLKNQMSANKLKFDVDTKAAKDKILNLKQQMRSIRNDNRLSPEGRAKRLARTNKRRAAKLNAIVAWTNLEKIKEIYKNCPKGFHVDHIIPLISDKVCGLHVENNLRIIPAKENIRKGNKLIQNLL